MPYINVDEAYILDNTGLQVDNSVDYANANSNRNLLDNPFFTVNQRNFTTGEGTAAGLALVDRWQAIRATVTRNTDNSLTVTPTQAQYGICQFIEQSRLKIGQTYTMSALIDNQYYSGSFVFSTSPASEYFATFSNGIRFYRHVANDKVDVWVIRSSTTAFAVQAVKLELGSYSTLANDTPPHPAEELAKCQRYFIRMNSSAAWMVVGSGWFSGSSNVDFLIPTPVTMRATPSASFTGTLSARGNSSEKAITSLGVYALQPNGIYIESPITSGTANQACTVVLNAGYIDLSADL